MVPPNYDGIVYFYNKSIRAGVFGYVNRYQICKTDRGPCRDRRNISSIPLSHNGQAATVEENVIQLLLLAMDLSSTCGSVQYRGAEALDTQSKILDTQSLFHAKMQWVVKVEKLFRTSMARMQLTFFNVAPGTAAESDGYHGIMPDIYSAICDMIKIPVVGWTNFTLAGILGTCLAVVLVWVFSRKLTVSDRRILVVMLMWLAPQKIASIEVVGGNGS